jgi:hypothetical protein
VNGSDATRDGLAAALRDYLNAPKEAPFRQRTLRLETLGYLARTVLLLWPAGDVLWEEDWESGAIHPDFYEIFGVPDPVLKKGVQGPGWALDPNGDSAHDSGVNARRVLDLSQGTYALEWRACLLAGGSKQREFHQAMRIQFCRAGRYQPGRDEPGHLVQVMQFALKADRALTGPILDLKSLAPVNPEHTGKLELGEDDLGRWHALRLELTGNEATVRMNGRTVARADVSRQTLADVQLALKGRSAHCHMLFDDIRLRRLPEGAGR